MVDRKAILERMDAALQRNPLFGDLLSSMDRDFLMQRGLVRTAAPGEVLCRQHQQDNRVFIIINGSVEVAEEVDGKQVTLAHLSSGELFGEIAALFMMPRIATVTVQRPTVLLELPGEVLEELIAKVPVIRDAVFERYRARTLQTALRAVPIFATLPDEGLAELSGSAAMLTTPKGKAIIREGEQGDALYVLNYGLARVYVTVGGKELNLALLRPGRYFGERALLTGAPRAASVAAVTQVETVRLGCEEFLEFVQKYPEVRDSIDFVAHKRHLRTQQLRGQVPESPEEVEYVLQDIQDILSSGDDSTSR